MRYMYTLILASVLFIAGCGDSSDDNNAVSPEIEVAPAELSFTSAASEQSVRVTANTKWAVVSDQQWCSLSAKDGSAGESILKINVSSNKTTNKRTATITFSSGNYNKKYSVTQAEGEAVNTVPAGYSLVWQDEFNATPNNLPSDEWWFETGGNGWGNNEPQYYVDRVLGTDTVAKIKNGSLIITAYKLATPFNGHDIISARMNTSKSWLYGYFEMNAKLAGGKGAWAAFWMMPKNFQSWPLDGEIDILEYVGYDPNVIHSTIHTQAYNHTIGTEKTGTKTIENAETDFHVYGLEWRADEIIGYVDGVPYFSFKNDNAGNKNTWPFDQPFYLKLNLAIGGNWGGQQGIDPAIFPARYEIDYVRVYQKK